MAKIHIGLVADDKKLEAEIQEAAAQFGGAYIHHSQNIMELAQKLSMQKVQLILMVLKAKGEGSDFGPIYQFIRNKKDLQNIPICLLTENPKYVAPFVFADESVRGFPLSGGAFMALLCMSPLLQANRKPEGAISEQWTEAEFLHSLKAKMGQELAFQVRAANDDEMHSPFYCQQSEEIRSHLGWFKFTARLLESQSDGLAKLFKGMDRDQMEQVAERMLGQIIEEFHIKVTDDLSSRGAIFLAEMEKLHPNDRKWIYARAQHHGILFSAPECQILLQMSKYI